MVPREVIWYCETKKIERKPWYEWKFPRSQVFWNLDVVPRIFRELWDKIFWLKNVIFRSQAWKVSIPENFWKVEVVTHEIFQYCEAKKIKGDSRYPAIEHKSLRCPKDSETKRDSLPSFVGSIREKNSTEKSDITLLGMKFFDSRTFLIYRSVPQRNFSALWDKKFSTESRDIPFFCIGFFDTWHLKLSRTLDGSSRSFSLLWDKKIEGKMWNSKKFPRSQTLWILEVVPRNSLRTVRQKTSNEQRDFPFSCIEKFGTRRFPNVRRGYARNVSGLWGQKNQRRIAIPRYWA